MPKFYVGVDISKFKHTCSIIAEDGKVLNKSLDIANNMEGFKTLLHTLDKVGDRDNVFVLMEATGHYHEHLFRFLLAHHIKVQIKNPVLIARFKESLDLNRAKTDKLDAMLLARYASMHEFTPSTCSLYNIERIKRLSRAKYFLYKDRTRTINLLHRYLDESFPELIPFLKERDQGKSVI